MSEEHAAGPGVVADPFETSGNSVAVIGQTVELAFAGGVLGAVANGVPLKRIWIVVGVAFVALAAATVVLQTLGLAPAIKVVP